MTVQQAYMQLRASLQSLYEPREAANIASLVLEHITGLRNSARIVNKETQLTTQQQQQMQRITAELITKKPVQYVLGRAWFYGMELFVNKNVLIPRPETEELAEWIIHDIKTARTTPHLLDIGTGSGCIAIAIKKKLPGVSVSATDVSEKALETAKKSADAQSVSIHFSKADILDKTQWNSFSNFNCIVSNPPYITRSEAAFISNHVLNFEPQTALFVEDNNPLIFYDAISSFALQHLSNEGNLYFEINELFGHETTHLLAEKGYKNIEIKKDMQGKNRMVKAILAG